MDDRDVNIDALETVVSHARKRRQVAIQPTRLQRAGRYFSRFNPRFEVENTFGELEGAFLGIRATMHDVGIQVLDGYITPTHMMLWVLESRAFDWPTFAADLLKNADGYILVIGNAFRFTGKRLSNNGFILLESDRLLIAADKFRRNVYEVHNSMLPPELRKPI